MYCLSIDHTLAGVAVRRRFAYSKAERTAIEKRFCGRVGCVLLVTCNRTEFYFNRPREETPLPFGERDAALFRFYEGLAAEEHLFRLAAGLESMLVGEDEILGQIRNCYEESRLAGAAEGLHEVFQAALACGKRVRSETAISSAACSIATLAVNEVLRMKRGEKNVLLVGATGNIGGSVLKNLISSGDVRVTATSRSHGFCSEAEGAVSADYADRYDYINDADAVISCTASPHTVFEAEKISRRIKQEKERLFIDLSVPPDIDFAVGRLGGCRLVGIDDLREAAEENNRKKCAAVKGAERIVAECLLSFRAHEAARRNAAFFSGIPESERKALFLLKKESPELFIDRCARLREREI